MIWVLGTIALVIFLLCVGFIALMKNGWENEDGRE